ncbi:ketoacyl-synthetase C-terminal extension domain-containing protein, partial [Pseudomonas aeruginosa]|uniref:ketoacyl-synthetase C-terminal extension domain-containing protein n=1 Tax=Pseudomonas aeruginosa TaxID=287 RepID=UPI0031B6BE5D
SIIYSIKNTLVLSLSMSQTGDITNLRPDEIMVSAQAWQDEMRYAGVSSFGIGGTNCHMIVASLPDALNARLPNTDSGRKSTALLLSAASDSALRRLATDYAGALRE